MDLEKIRNFSSTKELVFSTFYYVGGSILGPLIFFLGLGYFLDKIFQTKPILLVVGFFIAFVTSNVLLFQKVQKINKLMAAYTPTEKRTGDKKDLVENKK